MSTREHDGHSVIKKSIQVANHMANGAPGRTVKGAVKKTAKRGRRAVSAVQQRATGFAKSSERQVMGRAKRIMGWVKENPKTTIGALVGGGILMSVLGSSRIRKLALIGVGGVVTIVARRFA